MFSDTIITNDKISYMYKISPVNSDDNDNYDKIEICGWIKYYVNENYLDYMVKKIIQIDYQFCFFLCAKTFPVWCVAY